MREKSVNTWEHLYPIMYGYAPMKLQRSHIWQVNGEISGSQPQGWREQSLASYVHGTSSEPVMD